MANGEILGVSLLMEEVLTSGQQDNKTLLTVADEDQEKTVDLASLTTDKSVSSTSSLGSNAITAPVRHRDRTSQYMVHIAHFSTIELDTTSSIDDCQQISNNAVALRATNTRSVLVGNLVLKDGTP